mgnify:CR=1 FL=1|jgi:hypothetical protein
MNGYQIFFIIFVFYFASVALGSWLFPCPFGREKEEGWWDEEKTQPKQWVYAPDIGGAFGLPGHWELKPPPPPPPVFMPMGGIDAKDLLKMMREDLEAFSRGECDELGGQRKAKEQAVENWMIDVDWDKEVKKLFKEGI